ncbi:MAG: adenylyl-sulfate kinase [Psychroflexus sp.]|nr:adenylyl-sulfate kinase [Psychroflexus sp.]
MSENITIHAYDLTREKRNARHQHQSFVLWFTGLSGSGKSTIANKVESALFEKQKQVYSLDGDNIRSGINKGLGFTKEDRKENLRRIAEVAKLFVDAGHISVAAFVSPLASDRALVKTIIGEKDFIEIFVDTSLEECERRDVKGLYQKARAGEIKNFTGIDAPYEAPKKPAIHIKTEEKTVDQAVEEILNYIDNLI